MPAPSALVVKKQAVDAYRKATAKQGRRKRRVEKTASPVRKP